jgi:hypothetical protein
MIRPRTDQAIYFGLAILVGVGCGVDVDDRRGDGDGDGSGAVQGSLSSAERDGLVFTREEEKLARDVYETLEQYDSSFANIGASEQTHMNAVAVLLTRYGVDDPVAGNAVGEFTNPTLQTLYETLAEQGSRSLQTALAVGVEIEELDIHDIEEASKNVTHADILESYDNLTRGSRNHLRTFYEKLVSAGGSYSASHLDGAVFQAIIDSPKERGR